MLSRRGCNFSNGFKTNQLTCCASFVNVLIMIQYIVCVKKYVFIKIKEIGFRQYIIWYITDIEMVSNLGT